MLIWVVGTIIFAICTIRNIFVEPSSVKGSLIFMGLCMCMALARRPVYKGADHVQLPEENLPKFKAGEKDFLGEIYEKAQKDYFALEKECKLIKDPVMKAQLKNLSYLSMYILDYMRKNPQRIQQAKEFVYYYQDRALNLTQEFRKLEAVTVIKSAPIEETKANIRKTLQSFDEAYIDVFNKLISNKLLDINAELKVIQDNFAASGIEDRGIVEQYGEIRKQDDVQKNLALMKQPSKSLWNPAQRPLQKHNPHKGHPWTQKVLSLEEERRKNGYVVLHSAMEQQPKDVDSKKIKYIAKERANLPIIRDSEGKVIVPLTFLGDVKRQKKIVASLAILGGTIGLHKFYLRRIGKGFVYIIFMASGISTVVGICEGIEYLRMSPEDFYEKIYCP